MCSFINLRASCLLASAEEVWHRPLAEFMLQPGLGSDVLALEISGAAGV